MPSASAWSLLLDFGAVKLVVPTSAEWTPQDLALSPFEA